jgi:hypothetical protein
MKHVVYAKYTLAGNLGFGDAIHALRAKILTPCFSPKFFGYVCFLLASSFVLFPVLMVSY